MPAVSLKARALEFYFKSPRSLTDLCLRLEVNLRADFEERRVRSRAVARQIVPVQRRRDVHDPGRIGLEGDAIIRIPVDADRRIGLGAAEDAGVSDCILGECVTFGADKGVVGAVTVRAEGRKRQHVIETAT